MFDKEFILTSIITHFFQPPSLTSFAWLLHTEHWFEFTLSVTHPTCLLKKRFNEAIVFRPNYCVINKLC